MPAEATIRSAAPMRYAGAPQFKSAIGKTYAIVCMASCSVPLVVPLDARGDKTPSSETPASLWPGHSARDSCEKSGHIGTP